MCFMIILTLTDVAVLPSGSFSKDPSALTQVMFGIGSPVAIHTKVIDSPCLASTTESFFSKNSGGTAMDRDTSHVSYCN